MVIRLLKVEIRCSLQLTDGVNFACIALPHHGRLIRCWECATAFQSFFFFILNSDMTVLLHIAWWSSYQNLKCSVDLPSIMREFLDVSQFYSLLGAVTLQDLSISGVKSQTKLPVFQSEIIVNPRLHCTSLPCFASPHFLLPLLLDHLRFATKCMVKSLDI